MQLLLATTHTVPSDTFTVAGMINQTAHYIAKALAGDHDAIAHLAAAGIVPHYPLANPADRVCGSTWELEADGWHEVASGTPEQIVAALAAQELVELRPKWKERSASVRKRENKDIALDPSQPTDARIRALLDSISGA